MFKRVSRKAQIGYEVADPLSARITMLSRGPHAKDELDRLIANSQDVIQIRLNIKTATASFSSVRLDREAPSGWKTELKRWLVNHQEWIACHQQWVATYARQWAELQPYETALAEVDGRLTSLGLSPHRAGQRPRGLREVDSVPSQCTNAGNSEASRSASQKRLDSPDMLETLSRLCRAILLIAHASHRARLDASLVHIKECLDEVEHYRKKAGVTSTPVGFHDRVQKEIDVCYAMIAAHVQEQHARILHFEPQRPPLPSRESLDDDFILPLVVGPTALIRKDKHNDREYALYQGSVWECEQELETNQWRALADAYIQREKTELACALGQESPRNNREVIPSAVRRAVWQRDNGRCTQCGSRERLEFDHIISVAKGGSNTERNIELLCEVCNRKKSDSIM